MAQIVAIGASLASLEIDNHARAQAMGLSREFVDETIGFQKLYFLPDNQKSSDLCVEAWKDLQSKCHVDRDRIDAIILVTLHGDQVVPSTASLLQTKLGLREDVACFDVGAACTGYVYGLSAAIGFMKQNSFRSALLFTCDPYSRSVDMENKNVSFIFSDAATATLLDGNGLYELQLARFLTAGASANLLWEEHGGKLNMEGRAVVSFVLNSAPKQIDSLLRAAGLTREEIGKFIFHPGSQKLFESLCKISGIRRDRIARGYERYGNTSASSLPFLLTDVLQEEHKYILLSSFGAGMSCASAILRRVRK